MGPERGSIIKTDISLWSRFMALRLQLADISSTYAQYLPSLVLTSNPSLVFNNRYSSSFTLEPWFRGWKGAYY